MQLESRPFDMGKLLTSAVKVVFPQARYKGLVVDTEVTLGTTGWFLGAGIICGRCCSTCYPMPSSSRSRARSRCARAWPIP